MRYGVGVIKHPRRIDDNLAYQFLFDKQIERVVDRGLGHAAGGLPQRRKQLLRGQVHRSRQEHLGHLDALLGRADAASLEKTADLIHGGWSGEPEESGLIIEAEAGPA